MSLALIVERLFAVARAAARSIIRTTSLLRASDASPPRFIFFFFASSLTLLLTTSESPIVFTPFYNYLCIYLFNYNAQFPQIMTFLVLFERFFEVVNSDAHLLHRVAVAERHCPVLKRFMVYSDAQRHAYLVDAPVAAAYAPRSVVKHTESAIFQKLF